MLSLGMLDVAIGVVFLYLLLSLICTAINEFIESFLKLRAVDLEQGIRELVNNNTQTASDDIAGEVYSHPLIAGLFRGSYNTKDIRNSGKTGMDSRKIRYSRGSDLPSYIPARNFSLALMDVVMKNAKSQTSASQLPNIPEGDPLQQFKLLVEKITNDKIKIALLAIIKAAGNDLEKVRLGIEEWYNSAMDRVSGWYKRRVQRIVFFLGFLVAVALNADTFAVYTNLANDRPLRSAIVAQAEALNQISEDTVPSVQKIKGNVQTLLGMGLPVGWNWKNDLALKWNPDTRLVTNLAAIPPKSDVLAWLFKVIGWLVTGLAISLGAPFWFDVLNKIMVIRSTVKPREKSQDEGSEDRKTAK